jgi:hypothetical protein
MTNRTKKISPPPLSDLRSQGHRNTDILVADISRISEPDFAGNESPYRIYRQDYQVLIKLFI